METQLNSPADRSVQNYQIMISGLLNQNWSDWFAGMAIVSGLTVDGATVTRLTGPFADQAALRGVLNRLWDLNLTVLSIECLPVIKPRFV